MDTVSLVASVNTIIKRVLMGNTITTIDGRISTDKLRKPRQALHGRNMLFQNLPSTISIFRMRAQAIIEALPSITVQETEGTMIPLMDVEVEHCAAVIAAAFLNPSKFTV
jgi:hypothetical protein